MKDIEHILDLIQDKEGSRSSCFKDRIKYLKETEKIDPFIIETGVNAAAEKIQKKAKSFVIYGEPQSGKTEVMIALTCKLIDMGFQTIFIIVNDNTELENQNFLRFQDCRQLKPAPLRDYELNNLNDYQRSLDIPRVIFCRKNAKNLDKLIDNARHFKGRVIIDDEADFATPNTNINKIKKEASVINDKLGKLGKLDTDGIYIGVTATPGRLDLNNTYFNDTNDWIFLDSHKHYKGRELFFPLNNSGTEGNNYHLVLLPDEGDDPQHLRKSMLRFLLRASYLNRKLKENYSMLIHTAGKVTEHDKDQKDVNKVLFSITQNKEKVIRELIEEASRIFREDNNFIVELISFIISNIQQNQVLVINSKKDKNNVVRASNPKVLFTFAIGGNIVSRGLTFKNLLTFFFSRGVKGKLQQNTYIQRARMFGNRPYIEHFELCIPKALYKNWADCFQDHELSLRIARSGNQMVHVQGKKNVAADSRSIDKANIVISKGERQVGQIFDLTNEIKEQLISADHNPVDLIKNLIKSGLINHQHFDDYILNYVIETSDRPDDVIIVLRNPKGKNTTHEIQSVESYSGHDADTISRPRGGMIQALIKGRPMYDLKRHYIMPLKNENGKARFIYRPNLGHTILKNVRSHGD
jgi:hypothetical protein